MLRSTASKIAWVGRTASMVFGLALVLALILGVATTALSATGGNFILGKPNSAGSQTSLVGTVTKAAQSALVVVNKGTGSALDLRVTNTNSPPMKVNSSAKVTNLNADQLDGLDSGALRSLGAVSSGGLNPPATPSQGLTATTRITTPANGDLFIIGDVTEAGVFSCTNPPCTLTLGLYVDGQPVPGSARTITASGSDPVIRDRTFFALVPDVAPGEHTVQIGVNFGGNGGSYSGGSTAHTGVVFLGD